MTETETVRTWRALHLYCHCGKAYTDRLITETVVPAIRGLRAEGLIDSWFFIRYWEGGPHLRVRLGGADPERLDRAAAVMRTALEAPPHPEPESKLDAVEFYRQFSIPAEEAAALEWNADGIVADTEYRPEVERYGGPAGIGPSEDLFRVSSELAAAVVARTPDARARTGTALDLLLGFVSAMYETTSESVLWLREYATMWRYLDQAVAETFHRTREAAESTVAASGPDLTRRREALRESSPAAYRRWWDAVGATVTGLRGLDEAGGLVGDPDAVMVSHLHMLYNRLGLTASDEVYLAWMASLMIAAPGPTGDYFADGPTAPDRALHELSKFRPATMEHQRPRSGGPIPRTLPFASGEPIALPQADPAMAEASLATTIAARRSARTGLTGSIGLEHLASLLGLGVGVVGTEPYEWADPPQPRQVMANPSAGMAYPLIVRVLVRSVDRLRPALYEYLPRTHQLQQVGLPPGGEALRDSSPFFIGDPPRVDVSEAPAVLFLGAEVGRMRTRYGLRAQRFAMLEIGHAAQTLLLVSTALGLRAVPVGGFFDDAVSEIAQMDGYDEIIGYVMPLGSPSDGVAPTTNPGDPTS